jgi:hypothetical protein
MTTCLKRLLDQTNEELKRALEINATLSSQAQTAALEKEVKYMAAAHIIYCRDKILC